MTDEPRVPIHPNELPQQQIFEVVELPPRPEPFECIAGFWQVPKELRPKSSPRKVDTVCAVEWAWSPMNSRFDTYYLHKYKTHWILWTRLYDEGEEKWHWVSCACVAHKGIQKKVAAVHLLMEFWKADEDESHIGKFTLIDREGLLSVPEVEAIARKIW